MQGKDSCNGDSGGPLICDGIAVGIISYGDTKCGDYPAVYTRLAPFTKWISDYQTDQDGSETEQSLLEFALIYFVICSIFILIFLKAKHLFWYKIGQVLGWNPVPTTEAQS